jgi:hypothetical protein
MSFKDNPKNVPNNKNSQDFFGFGASKNEVKSTLQNLKLK